MADHITVARIVVGVDGSPGSKTALRWAMTQARLSGATVEAVATWQDGVMPVMVDDVGIRAITAKVLDDTITEVSGQLDQPVEVLTRVGQGHPARVLLDAAAGAQLMVVGSRGHGRLVGTLLGPVSRHCVQHAPCPVVVVPQ